MGNEFKFTFIACAAAFLVIAGLLYVQATNEAAAFNRLTTGPEVTAWDALFLDLRVEAR